MTSQTGAVVVLVHGAWHHPWHWHQLVRRLEPRVRVATVDLPSCNGSLGDLHNDAAAVRTTLDGFQNVLLVAHSYGGIPATEGAAGHPAVRRMIFLSAYMAELGESLGGFETFDEPNIHPQTDCAPGPIDGTMIIKPERAVEVLYHDCPESEQAAAQLRPMSLSAIGQTPAAVAWKDIPSDYVITTADRATAVGVQRRLSARATDVHEIDCGHTSFLARPDAVCRVIEGALRTISD